MVTCWVYIHTYRTTCAIAIYTKYYAVLSDTVTIGGNVYRKGDKERSQISKGRGNTSERELRDSKRGHAQGLAWENAPGSLPLPEAPPHRSVD